MENNSFNILDNICGYPLDDEQRRVVLCKNKNVLVSAGAGSGKTLTIIGKIRYLIEVEKVNPSEILVISFTNDTVKNLKEKLFCTYQYEIEVLTFHKLGLKILENTGNSIQIAAGDYLEFIVNEYFSGYLLENEEWMKKVLSYFKIRYSRKNYHSFIEQNSLEFRKWKRLIVTFIGLFRTNELTISDFYQIMIKEKKKLFSKKNLFTLRIILDIYLFYQNELLSSGKIDFDDMILKARDNIDKITFPYKYVIIDEYQDTSYMKFSLIQKLLKKLDANLLVVGDDFQSIYRFTGCDLGLFLNFTKYFEDSCILKITNTYRCPYELIKIAGSFIMKNQFQMKKELKSNRHKEKPITVIPYQNQRKAFERLLDSIDSDKEIMVIGRNNHDIYQVIDSNFNLETDGTLIYNKRQNLKIRFLTAHRSKGLESDIVIILHLEKGVYGFPSLIPSDPLLRYVNPYQDKYYLEEERRLFYVSLTRSKNQVYLLMKKDNPSIFVKEIIRYYKRDITVIHRFID